MTFGGSGKDCGGLEHQRLGKGLLARNYSSGTISEDNRVLQIEQIQDLRNFPEGNAHSAVLR
ncbi:hypothetical protein TRIP_B200372 [uncultured Desulfatiglans sp.]|uniref:Uncharacterized protein n=1 Tax=Uncultured Desulfatiglans sp. TaxID=1748965 RepID=A0A653A3K3_UNCDX|nr:hypothetical protein TRIP_B200372 [uncultured Desulfatiglans sp.]